MLVKNKPVLVALSGAGISAESGLKTFRDAGGLWKGYRLEEVATPEAWNADFEKVLEFYNLRRKAALEALPNAAHYCLAELEKYFTVHIITQNVDDLHERAGSSQVLHLHGQLKQSRSTANPNLIYEVKGSELNPGDLCELGSQLRPHIVWFGEEVPMIEPAANLVSQADVFLIIGTSLQVYPAAGLVQYFDTEKPMFIVDPKPMPFIRNTHLVHIQDNAVKGMETLKERLLQGIDKLAS